MVAMPVSFVTMESQEQRLHISKLFCLLLLAQWGSTHALEMECSANGEASCDDGSVVGVGTTTCGLYLAESTIPSGGLGVFIGHDMEKGSLLQDGVEILIADVEENRMLHQFMFNETLPRWSLADYTWEPSSLNNSFEADKVSVLAPGLGSLAIAHLGLSNIEKDGCHSYLDVPRTDPWAGSRSPYRDCSYRLRQTLKAGSELFVSYALKHFQDTLLSQDVRLNEGFKEQWNVISYGLETDQAERLWESLTTKTNHPEATFGSQLKTQQQRDLSWLNDNGVCIDHVRIGNKQDDPTDQALFARRHFGADEVVTTSPVKIISRSHLHLMVADTASKPKKEIMWQGSQLLLNSCYGDPSSSLLLFPLESRVHAINHPTAGQAANIGVRWSARFTNRSDWFDMTPEELFIEAKAPGLAFDFYALSDIAAGDELLLDYGSLWESAWEDHVRSWSPERIVHSDTYISAADYTTECNDRIGKTKDRSCMFDVPTWMETRCLTDKMDEQKERKGVVSTSCKVLRADNSGQYVVQTLPTGTDDPDASPAVETVPREAILFVNRPYTANQFLRSGFRKEIGLPNGAFTPLRYALELTLFTTAMIPETWRDLQDDPNSECGLFMAESAIPNSGLGMYTAKVRYIGCINRFSNFRIQEIAKDERIFYGDVVVQVEDVRLNRKLRYRHHGIRKFREPDWLLHNYYWDPTNAMAKFDARKVETVIPGLGMLANSHTGLVNAQHKSPRRFADFHRFLDPGAGASSTYHDVHFDALKTIEAGAELYAAYGDDWFAERQHLGDIPLSVDFNVADKAVEMVAGIGNNISDEETKSQFIVDAIDLFATVSRPRPRLTNALPKSLSVFEQVRERGTADLTVPDRVRSIDWLNSNGRCLDNIRPGISTIKQAGRGAFATRDIKKGGVVAPMPLVHLRWHHMEVYDSEDFSDFKSEAWRDGTQQLLNYCFGHPQSSLLFYAYAPVVNYINHSFRSPNVELKWSNLPNHQQSWLTRTPDDLDAEDHAGLIMELVAIRDIKVGEEILINYGPSWENAWEEFVNSWKPDPEDETYASSEKLNQELAWIRLTNETSEYPFSNAEDVLTGCFVDLSEKVKGPREQKNANLHGRHFVRHWRLFEALRNR
jgi:SET domain